jgi:UDP-GlcNAc:undecaprenyl-phosphate GlcNAc-1-phosphate transferase
VFGRGEFLLLAGRARNLGRSLVHPVAARWLPAIETQVRLQGSRQWELLWDSLTESAEKLGLHRIQLDLNLPMIQESFNATWERPAAPEPDRCWQIRLPLMTMSDQPIGGLTVCGQRNGDPVCQDIERLLEIVEPFEERLRSLAEQQLAAIPSVVPVHRNGHPPVQGMKG